MKKLLVLLTTLFSLHITAQSSITEIPGFDDLFNLNVEQTPNGDVIFSGAFQDPTTKYFRSVVGRVDQSNNILWSKELFWYVNTTFVVSDHTLLPSGDIALVGTAGNTRTGVLYDAIPIILVIDQNGNAVPGMGAAYTDKSLRPNSAVHKIIYSDFSKSLIITGSLNMNHPLTTTKCVDREVFVMSVDATNLAFKWLRTLDTNKGSTDVDYGDCLLDLGSEGIFVAGTLTDGNSGYMLISRLDHNGTAHYVHGVDTYGHTPFPSDAIRVDNEILLMSNDIDVMRLHCINLQDGQVNTSVTDNSPLPSGQYFTGHRFLRDKNSDIISISGYISDHNYTPTLLHPFTMEIDQPKHNCQIVNLSASGHYFNAVNSVPTNHYYQQLGNRFNFINTPDISAGELALVSLIGYRNNNSIDLNKIHSSNRNGCVKKFYITFLQSSADVVKSYSFNSPKINVYNDGTISQKDIRKNNLQCQSDLCPKLCPIQIQKICGINYNISAGCLVQGTNVIYNWNIPGLTSGNGSTISVSSLGGTYTYFLTIEYTDQFGQRRKCSYHGSLVIPNFSCYDININETISHICNDEFQLDLNVDPGCLSYRIIDVDLVKVLFGTFPICTVFSNETGSSIPFDLSTCGYGDFELRVVIEIVNGMDTIRCNKVRVLSTSPPLVGPYIIPIADVCTEKIKVLTEFRKAEFAECPLGSSYYLYAKVTNPVGPCYQYFWNGNSNPGGTTFICCDADPACLGTISLAVKDTCNCCDYEVPNIYNAYSKSSTEEVRQSKELNIPRSKSIQSQNNSIEISPNPTTDYIRISHFFELRPEILIRDISGHLLLNINDYEINQRIDVGHLKAGSYTVTLFDKESGDFAVQKFIIIR